MGPTEQPDPAEGHSTLKQRAAAASIVASTILAVLKLAAGTASGSLALLSEGAHNTIDVGASALTLFAVREADKPADVDHPFGHAKIEAVAALAETGFLAALSIAVAVEAIGRIRDGGAPVDVGAFAIGAILFSIIVDVVRWRALTHVARATSSHALSADALHYSSDLVSSVLVLIGLIATRAGYAHADALAAIGVSGFIAVAGYRLGRATIDALVDRAPEGLADALRTLVMHNTSVAGIEAIRLRPSGAKIVGDVVVSVSRTLPLERVAGIKAELQSRIARRWPEAELTITANPLALDNETILERVLVIAARRGLPVHHVTIQDIEARKTVALDLEVNGAMTLGDAHRLASELEDAIAEEIGEDVEVETHIEPAEPESSGQFAEPDLAHRIEASLAATAAEQGRVRDIHNVRVRKTPGGVFVLFHCRVDPATPVETVHAAVDSLERSVREAFPEARRVVGHAEPAGTEAGG
ncbi:MAG TPA: cation-efflux pump [Roseiarcus sp.]|jgi:cation diffusion facilitator family transporter